MREGASDFTLEERAPCHHPFLEEPELRNAQSDTNVKSKKQRQTTCIVWTGFFL